MKKLQAGLLLALAFTATGCGDDVEAEDVAARTSKHTAALVREAVRSAEVLDEVSSLQSLGRGSTALQQAFQGLTGGSGGAAGGEDTAPIGVPVAPDEESTDAALEELTKFLETRVFTDENVESANGSSAVFLLEGEDICTDGSSPADEGCVEAVDEIEIRVRATLQGEDGVDLALLLGPDQDEPLVALLRAQSLALQVDLGEAKAAATHIANLAGEELELPRVMAGRFELKLEKNGDRDVTLSASVLDGIAIEADTAEGPFTFSTGAKSPLVQLRLEAPARRVSFDFDLGRTQVGWPATHLAGTGAAPRMALDLSGASASVLLEENMDSLTVAHLGLGEARTSLELDDTEIFTADLNALSGRHFDLHLEVDADGLPLVRVTPEVDLATRFFFSPLADRGESVESYLLDDSYRFRLSGAQAPTVKPLEADAVSGFPGGLKVVAGQLELSSGKAGVPPVVVSAGQCLVGEDTLADGEHPFLGHFAVQTCP